jgi:hypothetical protein
MRFHTASLGLLLTLTSAAPALAQEAPPAESPGSNAPIQNESVSVDALVEKILDGESPPVEESAAEVPDASEAKEAPPAEAAGPSPEAPAPTKKRARKKKRAPEAPMAPVRPEPTWRAPADLPPEMERRSPGMMAGGIVLTVLGGLSTVGGALLSVAGGATGSGELTGAGLAGVGGGVLFLGAGIGMITNGAKRVPVEGSATTSPMHGGGASHVQSAPATQRNSPAMLGVGIPLIVAGGISTLATIPQLASGDDTATALTLGAGILGLGVGIPITVVGAKKVPFDETSPGPQAKLRLGPGSVDFSMEF